MALNDRKMNEKVENARSYFSKLRSEADQSPTKDAEIKDRKMLEAAAWASSFLSNPLRTSDICEKLHKNGYLVSMSVEQMKAQGYVNSVVGDYGVGQKKFDEYTFQQIERVLDTMINHINLLNQEKAAKLYYEKMRSEDSRKGCFIRTEKKIFKEISKELDLPVKKVEKLIRDSAFNKQSILEDYSEDGIYAPTSV